MREVSEKAGRIYQENRETLEKVIEEYHKDELGQLCQHYPGEKTSMVIDWGDMWTVDPGLAEDAEKLPGDHQAAFEQVVLDMVPQEALKDRVEERVGGDDKVIRGEQMEVVFANAGDPQQVSDLIQGDSVGELVTLRGQATKATDTRPKLTNAALRCSSCGGLNYIWQPTHGSEEPNGCDRCDSSNVNWDPELSESDWTLHQLVRIKHEPGESETDSWIDVHITGDSAGALNGGESVDVTGVLKDVWPDGIDSGEPEFILDAHSVRKHESDFESIDIATYKDRVQELAAGEEGDPYELLVDSIAPGIFGGELMDRIKLSLAMQLFGGRRIENDDGTATRGDIHQLMVGAPGTGKSTLQDAVKEYSPRASTVSGKNASKAGITAAAVRDDFGDTEWSIDAGAFVQAHKGICIIDELDKVDGDALSSLHSALERQELSVAKAGINANLKCHTSLLGAANPEHERWVNDPNQTVIEQIPVGSAMRSRLDAIFVLRDDVDEEDDAEKVEHMLKSLASGDGVQTENFDERDEISAPLDKEEIQAWVAYARQEHDVAFDMELLVERIKDYYVSIRQESKDTGAPVTIRKPEAIVRYAVASARIRLAEVVEEEDIERAISVVGASLAQVGMTEDGQLSGDAGHAQQVSQANRKQRIKNALTSEAKPAEEIAEEANVELEKVNGELEQMYHNGVVVEPTPGEYREV
jgi:replicative DNA helicase Mcm